MLGEAGADTHNEDLNYYIYAHHTTKKVDCDGWKKITIHKIPTKFSSIMSKYYLYIIIILISIT